MTTGGMTTAMTTGGIRIDVRQMSGIIASRPPAVSLFWTTDFRGLTFNCRTWKLNLLRCSDSPQPWTAEENRHGGRNFGYCARISKKLLQVLHQIAKDHRVILKVCNILDEST